MKRLAVCLLSAALAVPFAGCDDKLGKLKAKAEEAERELADIERENLRFFAKTAEILALTDQLKDRKLPADARARKQRAIDTLLDDQRDEQRTMARKREELLKKLGALSEEVKELGDVELAEALDYLLKNLPKLAGELQQRFPKWFERHRKVQGSDTKLQRLERVMRDEARAARRADRARPGSRAHERAVAAAQRALARHARLSFDSEIMAAGRMVEMLDHLGPLPVLAGSRVDRVTFPIEEGLPESVAHASNGTLAPGTEIVLELPPGWSLEAPVQFRSENLTVAAEGNEPGSGLVRAQVTREARPRPDDRLFVVFDGIRVGAQTGVTRAALAVMPGRVSAQEFYVVPARGGEPMPTAAGAGGSPAAAPPLAGFALVGLAGCALAAARARRRRRAPVARA